MPVQPLESTKKVKVLLIEDSRSEAIGTEQMVLGADDGRIEMQVAPTLQDSLDVLEKNEMDAVILDLGLPDSDGPESINTLNHRFPKLPIVILSGRTDEVAVMKSLEYGAQEFLLKGECSGPMIRQAIFNAMFRKSLRKSN